MSGQKVEAPAQRWRAGEGKGSSLGRLAPNHSPGGPVALVLDRLERVKPAGKGFYARCPAHPDKTASLSIAEGRDGRCLVHCFAGCSALDVLAAIGLTLADLYPVRLAPATPEHRRELAEFAKLSRWKAALGVLASEADVVRMAGASLARWQMLTPEDEARLVLACERIERAREVLA